MLAGSNASRVQSLSITVAATPGPAAGPPLHQHDAGKMSSSNAERGGFVGMWAFRIPAFRPAFFGGLLVQEGAQPGSRPPARRDRRSRRSVMEMENGNERGQGAHRLSLRSRLNQP